MSQPRQELVVAGEKSREQESRAANALLTARAIPVNTAADKFKAVQLVKELMDYKDEVKDVTDTMVKPLERSVADIKKFFKTPATMYDTAISAVKSKVLTWMDEDSISKLEESQLVSTEALKKREELQGEAKRLRAEGQHDRADDAEMMAEMCVAIEPIEEGVSDGSHIRVNWAGKVVDFDALIDGVANGSLSSSLLKVDQAALNKLAAATKGLMDIPGVKWRVDKTLVVRRK